MKKIAKITSLLVLCVLMTVSPIFSTASFAEGKIVILSQNQSGDSIVFSGTAPEGTLYAACYSLDGRMQKTVIADIKGNSFSVPVSVHTGEVSFFVLDRAGKPVTDAAHALVIGDEITVHGGVYNNVLITPEVGDGDVMLDGVKIQDKLVVQGGGSNSVHLDGCSVDTIEVAKDTTDPGAETPRIELNSTPVKTIEAVQPVIIEADANSTVNAVEAKSDVTVQGAATKVENVTVPAAAANQGVKLTVDGA